MAYQTLIAQIVTSDEYQVLLGGLPNSHHLVQEDTVTVDFLSSTEEGSFRFGGDTMSAKPSSLALNPSKLLLGSYDSLFVQGDPSFGLTFSESQPPLQNKVKTIPHISSKKVYWS